MPMKKLFLIIWLALQCTHAWAIAQDHAAIRERVSTFVQQQTAALPGKASFHVNDIDKRIVLSRCEQLEAFLPAGSKLIGNTSVGVRCSEKDSWSIIVPVQIKISLDLLVSARQLPAGHTLRDEDVSSQTTEIAQTAGITDPKQVVGKVLRYGIAAGQMLREDMLRPPYSVLQGQTVQIIVQGRNFSVRSSGVAMNDASAGKPVKVRNESGRVLNGVARPDGGVEIAP